MNEELINLINEKKEIIFAIDKFSDIMNDDYMRKLLSLLYYKGIQINIISINETKKIDAADKYTIIVSDNAEIINYAKKGGISVIGLAGDKLNEAGELVIMPDARSLYNAFNWILNSHIAKLENEPLRKVTSVIPAAGKGTRLGFDKPKALYSFLGKTALEIIYEKLKPISDKIIVIASEEGEKEIRNFVKNKGLDVEIVVDPEPYGSAGSIAYAFDSLDKSKDTLVIWVDHIGVPQRAIKQIIFLHQKNVADLSIPTRMRNKPYIHLERDERGAIKKVMRKRFNDAMPSVGENETGVFIIKGGILINALNEMREKYWQKRNFAMVNTQQNDEFDFLEIIPELTNRNYKVLTAPCIIDEEKMGFNTIEEVKYHEERIRKELGIGKIGAVFIDRDGVINEDVGYAKSIDDIKLIKDIPHAIKLLKEAGLKIFVITNQAIISRGYASESEVEKIHEQINDIIAKETGIRIDKFYFCPHHPNADIEKYRKICDCRKPAPGLILRAAQENGINTKKSWMIGDKITDIVAGKNAGCRTILIKNPKSHEKNVSGFDFDINIKADHEVDNILGAVKIVSENPN